MKHRSLTTRALALSAATLLVATTSSQAQTVFGVTTTGSLFSFNATTPLLTTTIGTLSFIPEGIDFNPLDGTLYGIDVGASTTQLYTISLSGVATPVGLGFASNGGAGANLTTATAFGFDFNPKTVSGSSIRIRLVTNDGTNLRLDNTTGLVATVDTSSGTENLASGTVDATGAAYINNKPEATAGVGTTLKIIDTVGNRVLDQNPPNNGTLINPLPLGIDATGDVGFDVFTAADGTTNTAYLTTEANAGVAGTEFYTVSLGTGAATLVGTGQIGAAGTNVRDFAVQPVPEPTVCAALLTGLLTLGLRRRRQA